MCRCRKCSRTFSTLAGSSFSTAKYAAGTLWIGTDGAGLFQYSAGRFRNYRTEDGLRSNQIRAFRADRTGALWISTFGSGLTRYANGSFSIVGTNGGLAGDRVVAIHEDEEGALWFATRRGLSPSRTARSSPGRRNPVCSPTWSTPWWTTAMATSGSVPPWACSR